MSLATRLAAETLGSSWLVFGSCSSAVLAAAFPAVGIGLLGVSARLGPDRVNAALRYRRDYR